jgi:hypothetical protein
MSESYQVQRRSRDIENRVSVVDQQAADIAESGPNGSFLSRLFPGEIQREAARSRLNMAQNEFEFREKALRVLRDTQLRAIQEFCNDNLVRWGAGRHVEMATFIMECKSQLEERVTDLTDRFHDRVIRAYEKAENLPIPRLRDRELAQLESMVESYHAAVEELRRNFQTIVEQTATRHGL